MLRSTLAAAMALSAATAAAHDMGPGGAHVDDIIVEGAFARAAARPGGASAAYMTIRTLDAPDRLIAASSDVAERVELHAHMLDDQGVARMREVAAIAVEPGADTVLEPGGLHVMLMGLRRELAEGDMVDLTLTFETTGEVAVAAPVRAFGRLNHGGHGAGHGGAAKTN